MTPFLQESTRIAEDSKTVPALTSSSQPTGHATTTPLPVTGEVQFELLTQQGGMYKGISISGDIAWLGQGPRLVGLNLADPTNPQKISQSEILPGTVKSLLVRDTVAYVMAGRTLVMLDVSNPRSPQ